MNIAKYTIFFAALWIKASESYSNEGKIHQFHWSLQIWLDFSPAVSLKPDQLTISHDLSLNLSKIFNGSIFLCEGTLHMNAGQMSGSHK